MFKFLRRYNKWILAVGGTLLMIVFLIPQAIQGLAQIGGARGATRATIGPDAEAVSGADLERSSAELQFMERVGLGVPALGPIRDPWHWYLLVREAEDAGLVGGRLNANLDPEQARDLRRQTGLEVDQIETTLARINGVSRLISLYQTAGEFSDRRLRAAAKRLFDGARVRPVVIPARADASDHEPTDAEIAAHFEQWKDADPNDPESRFGYRLPDRAKLEWIVVPAADIRAMIEASDAVSGTELRKHWRRFEGREGLPPLPETPPTEVPDVVREHLVDQLVQEKTDEIERWATNQLRAKTHGLSRSEGYLALPDDWDATRLALPDLAAEIADHYQLPLPTYEAPGRWLTAPDMAQLEGIGLATTPAFPPRPRRLNELVMLSRELQGSTTILIQEGVAGAPLRDGEGDLYFWRIIDTDPSRPPTSPDEVRDRIVEDLRRLRHYEMLVDALPAMESTAANDGLVALALAHDTSVGAPINVARYDEQQLNFQMQLRLPLDPRPTALPVIGGSETAVDAILEHAAAMPRQIAVATEAQRIVGVPVEDRLAVVVARIEDRVPMTEDRYRTLVKDAQLQVILLSDELDAGTAVTDAFGYDALAERHAFKVIRSDTDEDGAPEGDGEAPTQTAAAE